LGTKKTFDAFTFAFEQTEHGWFAVHAYQFDATIWTFIVETPESVWMQRCKPAKPCARSRC